LVVALIVGGLVGVSGFGVLPNITPSITAALTLLACLPSLVPLWRRPSIPALLSSSLLCALSAFLFGWHVHEKAIMTALVPLGLLSLWHVDWARLWVTLATTAHVSFFPLIFTPIEGPVKYLLTASYFVLSLWLLHSYHHPASSPSSSPALLTLFDKLYLAGFAPVLLLSNFILPALLSRFEFLPLLLISCYCSIGTITSWIRCYRLHFAKHE